MLEARIELQAPAPDDCLCGVATLTPLNMAASRLLGKSDRWRDDAVMSRDLIDLAMMAPRKTLLKQAKAQGADGESVGAGLASAMEDLRARPHRLDPCMQAVAMSTVSKAALWVSIGALVR